VLDGTETSTGPASTGRDYPRQTSSGISRYSRYTPTVEVEAEVVDMQNFKAGDLVVVIDMTGKALPKRALGPVVPGGSFDVVWACREEEWVTAQTEGRKPEGLPWPAEDVRLAEGARAR
jgi:hypothetical protein